MRYSYYKSKSPSPKRPGTIIKYLFYVLTFIILGIAFTVWNRAPRRQPDHVKKQAFYEGYFTLNTRLTHAIGLRFPSLSHVESQYSDDGHSSHLFKVNDPKKIKAKDIRQLLDGTLGGYGFTIEQTIKKADLWEFHIAADSVIWSIYRFEFPGDTSPYASLLPADLMKVKKPARLSLIIDDFGYSMNETISGFIALPFNYSASVIPNRPYSKQVSERLKQRGREILIHMPMITVTNSSSEPDLVLSDDLSDAEMEKRLKKARATVPHAVGMNNHQGSGGTQSRKVMEHVADFLHKRNMFFVDSRTIAASIGETVAREKRVPTNSRDVFLDDVDDQEAIAKELFRLARLASDRGEAIGIGHCRPNTLKTLKKYLPALAAAGYEILPVSKLVR